MRSSQTKKLLIAALLVLCCSAGAAVKISLDSPATFPVDI